MRARMLPGTTTRERTRRLTCRTGARLLLTSLLALTYATGNAASGAKDASGAQDASDAQDAAAAFAQCTAGLQARALADGLPPAAVTAVFDTVEQLPRAIAADRKQPEFTQTFATYYNKRVHEARVQRGRALVREHRTLLQRVERSTGIPAQYLVALWGLETNFGSYFGSLSIPSALATLACDARRSEFFTRELLAVLRIVADGDLTPKELRGSWAGAMGHMQFMPSTFVRYAVDADADGRRDLRRRTALGR